MQAKIFPDAQLGSERQVLELLQLGSVAMTKVSAAALSNFVPSYKVLGIPYIFRDEAHRFAVLEGEVGENLLVSGDKFLLRGLCFYDAGSRSFYTKNKAIRTPDDLKGLKIRVMNDQTSISMIQAMGGSATPMAFGELYTALQQGVVDGAENNPPSLVSSNHFEVCKYYTLDEHSSVPDVLVVSTKFWNRLSPDQQKMLKDAAMYSSQQQKDFWKESVDECFKKLAESGVEVIRPDKSLFANSSKSVLERFEKDAELNKIIQQIKAL